MRRKIISVIFISILITGSLSGCGKSGEDEISDSLESLQDTASSTNADDSTADGGIPNHLSYSVASNNGVSINVEADVISLGYQNAPIYEAEVIEVDDDLIAEYAEKLFDAASYDVIKPYSMFSEQELKDEQEFIYEQINSRKNRFGSDRFYCDLLRIESYIRNYDESNVSELAEGQLIYKSDSYSSAKLRGLIDGEQWELSYEAINGDEPQQSIKFYTCEDIDWSSSTVSMDDEAVDKYGENLSTLETSQKSAVNMLERLGYENMEVIHTGQQLYEDYNESWTDGYKLVFARSIGTMQIGFKDNSIVLVKPGKKIKIGERICNIEIPANKKVVIKLNQPMSLDQPITFTEEKTGRVFTGKVTGNAGFSPETKYYITTINEKVYITENLSSMSGSTDRYYVTMDDETFFDSNNKCIVGYSDLIIDHTVVFPKGIVKTETNIYNADEELHYIWKIVDGELVKQYVNAIYHVVNNTITFCVLGGLNEGDIVARDKSALDDEEEDTKPAAYGMLIQTEKGSMVSGK